jgi:hypothetical protein
MTRLLVRIALSVFVLGCGGSGSGGGPAGSGGSGGTGPADNCSDFSGTYSVTTEIVSTDCALGLHAISPSVTWTFAQTAPSCNFTMTNSLYPTSQYSGYFSMEGSQTKVTWTSVAPAPVVGGRALTYTGENLAISPGAISGSFDWSAVSCTGTTNVCSGSVATGCP